MGRNPRPSSDNSCFRKDRKRLTENNSHNNFTEQQKDKIGTEAQFRKPRARRDEARRGVAWRAAEEEERACMPLLFTLFRR